jgi:hypothetical protein
LNLCCFACQTAKQVDRMNGVGDDPEIVLAWVVKRSSSQPVYRFGGIDQNADKRDRLNPRTTSLLWRYSSEKRVAGLVACNRGFATSSPFALRHAQYERSRENAVCGEPACPEQSRRVEPQRR